MTLPCSPTWSDLIQRFAFGKSKSEITQSQGRGGGQAAWGRGGARKAAQQEGAGGCETGGLRALEELPQEVE